MFSCLLERYLICSAVLELILFLVYCFHYDGFIHIAACGSLGPGPESPRRGDRNGDGAIKQERAHYMGCMCVHMRGFADLVGKCKTQIMTKSFIQFSLQSLCRILARTNTHITHSCSLWTSSPLSISVMKLD